MKLIFGSLLVMLEVIEYLVINIVFFGLLLCIYLMMLEVDLVKLDLVIMVGVYFGWVMIFILGLYFW